VTEVEPEGVITEARRIASMIGVDCNDYNTEFGQPGLLRWLMARSVRVGGCVAALDE
jgi:hypothetical protein